MTNYVRVSEILPHNNISLIANRSTAENVYDVMKYQPSAKLLYESDRGIFCDDKEYLRKVNAFINVVVEKQPALVITPEGAIPFVVLEDIIRNKSKWPDENRLWCLCMAGINKNDFKDFVRQLDENENISMFLESEINYRKHVNSLFYLFRLDDEHLAIVIQLKNNHMSDRGIDHEADDLSKGNTIYIFDLNNSQITRNVLLTLICADAIQLSMAELISGLNFTYPLVINAQCNPKPFNHRFVETRSSISTDSNLANQRQIVVNWARDTSIKGAFTIIDSGNTYYNYMDVSGQSHINGICSDAEIFKNRIKNQIKGGTYYVNENVNIWKFPDEENLLRFYVKKDDVFGVNPTLVTKFDPEIKDRYEYNIEDEVWNTIDKYCVFSDSEITSDIYISTNELLRPVNYSKCSNGACNDKCIWLYNDYFLGICFGGSLKDELKCEAEKSNRGLISMNEDSSDNTFKKRGIFEILVKLLEENKIPDQLNMFSENIKFEIDFNAAECGSDNIYNVVVENIPAGVTNWGIKKGIFAVLDTRQIAKVEEIYDTLYKSTNIENRDQILLYYRKGCDYVPYVKPHELKSIIPTNNNYTKNTSSFFKGESQYEQD